MLQWYRDQTEIADTRSMVRYSGLAKPTVATKSPGSTGLAASCAVR